MSAKEVDNRSKDELLHTISHLEGQLQEEVSSVRNFSIIGVGVFAAGLVGLLVFDASSLPLEHRVLPGLNIADQAEREFVKTDRKDKRNLDKTVKTIMSDTLGSGRAILAETNFGAIYGPDAENSNAVHVAAVVEGSSAAKAKIEVGQVIETIDGKTLRNARDYRKALQTLVNMQKVSVEVAGKKLEITYEAKISFPDFKHGLEHFAHTIDEKVELFWAEQKLILLKHQADLFKLKAAVKLAESYVVSKGAENERLKTAKVAVENLQKDHKKRLEVRKKGLEEALKLSAGHFADVCEKEEGLKNLVFGDSGFLTAYSKTLSGYWGPRVDAEVKIESGRAYAFAQDQSDADDAYKVYISWMEPKLIEYFGTPTEPRLKDYNSKALLEDNDIEEPDEPASIALLKQGQSFYFRHCQHCHGVSGYGDGPTAPFLNPRPRNYTHGIFKLRSNTSPKPSIKDLERTIRYGMPGSMMPPFELYRSSDIKAVAHYVRYLAIRGQVEKMVYDGQIKSKTLQAELKAAANPDPDDEDEPEDPMNAVKEEFNEFYEIVRIDWQSVKQKEIKVIGKPVEPATKVPATLGSDMLGELHKSRLESFQNLTADKPSAEWKTQLSNLESALEA
ncbi:MAG: c-type cytochrome, partial [Planctomycetota bacterium]|nr:c-type cytochrome [Planctomycetota bacterium]